MDYDIVIRLGKSRLIITGICNYNLADYISSVTILLDGRRVDLYYDNKTDECHWKDEDHVFILEISKLPVIVSQESNIVVTRITLIKDIPKDIRITIAGTSFQNEPYPFSRQVNDAKIEIYKKD